MSKKPRPVAEVFPPGDFIREEIKFRGWSQGELARILGRPLQVVNQIINAKKAITPQTARELEAALGPSAKFWLNLEATWQLSKEDDVDPGIAVRARALAKVAPQRARHRIAAKGN